MISYRLLKNKFINESPWVEAQGIRLVNRKLSRLSRDIRDFRLIRELCHSQKEIELEF